jgi:hypothetical protein
MTVAKAGRGISADTTSAVRRNNLSMDQFRREGTTSAVYQRRARIRQA